MINIPRRPLCRVFTILLFAGLILGCDLFENSLVGYSLDNIDIARVTGLNIKTPYAMMDDDTILVPPGTATVGMLLSNPRKFSVRQELLGVPDGKNITARQIGPAEIEVHIDGAAEGDDYALTLAMQSPDGLRDFPAYPLRIKCVSFETALQDFTVDGTTPAAFDPAGSALVVNVPYTSAAVTLGGTTVNPDAVIEIYAGTDDSGAVLAGAVHTVTTSPALVVGENHFYVKVTSPALTVRGYAVTIYRDTGLGITIGITV
ncbi:MAG: cadherin-like beta sandwich domain-containing protein, partial [Spirochaetaceae bacterium]|nr:cadherin-like beta sandwich domain-containing protein [Spirochaetaceae bacterium]